MAKTSMLQVAYDLMNHNNIKYVSGCFVYQNKKYSPRDFIIKKLVIDKPKYYELFNNVKDVDSFISCCRSQTEENIKEIWPLSSFALQAKESRLEPDFSKIKLNEAQLALIAQILYHPYQLQRFIIISGKAGTGKSTFLNLIGQLLDNDIGTIENTRGSNYDLDTVLQYRLSYSDDLIGKLPIEEGRLKSIVTHGRCQIDPKFQTKYTFANPQTLIVFLANKDPYVDISDPGILRRILWFSMDDKVKNPDPDFGTKIYDHDELLNIAICAKQYDDIDYFNKYFKQDTIKHLIDCNSVWKYIEQESNQCSYGHYVDYMMSKHNKNIYAEENYDSLIEAYTDYVGVKHVCEDDVDLNNL